MASAQLRNRLPLPLLLSAAILPITAIAPLTVSPAFAQGNQLQTRETTNLAVPFGDQGGTAQQIEIPAGAKVLEFAVYQTTEGRIAGIEILFQPENGGNPSRTQLIGARVGNRFRFELTPQQNLRVLELSYTKGQGIRTITFQHNEGASGTPGKAETEYRDKTLPEGSEFAGITAMADGQQIYAIGLLSRPIPGYAAKPKNQTVSSPWGDAEVQASTPARPSDWAQQTAQQQPQQQPQNNTSGGWANQQQPQNNASGGWGNQAQAPQQNTGSGGWANQQPPQQQQPAQQANTAGWANNTPAPPASTPSSSPPPWANNGGSSQSAPPWASNGGQGGSTGGSGQQQPAADIAELYSGQWVERDYRVSEKGDGLVTAVTWSQPKIVSLERIDANTLILRFDSEIATMIPLRKNGETSFTSQSMTANFRKSGKSYYMTLTGSSALSALSGSFEMAKTADGVLSKNRYTDTTQSDRRERYSLDGIAREWNTNLFGYDGLRVNLDRVRDGQKAMIFQQPASNALSLDDNLGLAVPFGLRGERIRDSSLKIREAVISNASEYQKSYSLNFGVSAPFGSTSTEIEITKGGAITTTNLRAKSYANIERYALILDKPNIELSDSFRQAINDLADGRMTAAAIIDRFGSHYANAITYGGIAKAEKIMSSTEVKEWSGESVKTNAGGTFKGVTANVGGGSNETRSTTNSSVFTSSDFNGRGGTGATSLDSWQVDDNNTVPVRYDLRPLSDLISPVFFKSGADGAKVNKYSLAWVSLTNAVASHMRKTRVINNKLIAYELEVLALRCLSGGDDGRNGAVELTGDVVLKHAPGSNILDTSLLYMRTERSLTCNGIAKAQINDKFTFADPKKYEFRLAPSNLLENDPTAFDADERVNTSSDKVWINIARVARTKNWVNKTVTFTGGANAPRLVVDYRMRKLF